MADFGAVLKRTIDGLGDAAPAVRQKVYQKARATIEAKLAAMNPPAPVAVADRQRSMLEDAIRQVEASYTSDVDDPFADLERELAASRAPARAEIRTETHRQTPRSEPSFARAPAPAKSTANQVPPMGPPVSAPMGERVDDSYDLPEEEGASDPVTDRTIRDDFPDERISRRSYGRLIAAVVALLVVAGGAYAAWTNQDELRAMLGMDGTEPVASAPEQPVSPAEPIPTAAAPTRDESEPLTPKFTQRLTTTGEEIDEGPAGGAPAVGEGTSVAGVTPAAETQETSPAPEAVSQPTTPPPVAPVAEAAPAEPVPATDPAQPTAPVETSVPAVPPVETAAAPPPPAAESIAVGQKAIFYEERTNVSAGSAEVGNIVWSMIQQSPGGDLPPEPAIRAEATIPAKDIQLRMTISRNTDKTLPASHIIELIFLTPDNFEGGGIENILRFTMKNTEQATGSAILGIPAKIADGFFLVALNDSKPDIDANLRLLGSERWIDVPVVYKSGRRALITLEKGIPGEKVFTDAIRAWQSASAAGG